MSKLSTDEVKEIADLAMINLTEAELEKFAGQLTSILEYVHKLSEVDTEKIDFKSHVELENVTSADEPEDSLAQKAAVEQTASSDGYITIAKVIGDEE